MVTKQSLPESYDPPGLSCNYPAISIHILSPKYKTQNDIVAMLPFYPVARIVLTSCQWGISARHCR